MKPRIGLFVSIDDGITKVSTEYIYSLEASGGIPIIIPSLKSEETIDYFINQCDGFLFTGGKDVDPKYYGEIPSPNIGLLEPDRDVLEFSCFNKIFNLKKPIMAICRGAQLVNVALGGTLMQDIPSEIDTNINHRQTEVGTIPSHIVNVENHSPLFELIGTDKLEVNSFHHQSIKKLGDGLKIMACAPDGVVEAVYYTKGQYIRAYQWHPERQACIDPKNKKIFEDFINECKKRAN